MTDGFKGSVSKSGIKGNYLYTVKYLIKKKKKAILENRRNTINFSE